MVSFTCVKLAKLEDKSWTMTTPTPCCEHCFPGVMWLPLFQIPSICDSECSADAHVEFQLLAPSWRATPPPCCTWLLGRWWWNWRLADVRCHFCSFWEAITCAKVELWKVNPYLEVLSPTDSACWVWTESVLCYVICAIARMNQHLCVSPSER